ncbi:MAG: hypothetical protein IJI07_02625 [Flexilinea sp.]|nr:hypothetical protein [Flexilinea sp.]
MKTQETEQWTYLLKQPGIPSEIPSEEIYHAACIGAVTLLYEAGDAAALADLVLHASAPESRNRALAALKNLTKAPEGIRTEAVRRLYELAVLNGQLMAADFLLKSGLQDTDPGWNSAGMLLFGQKSRLLKADPGPEKLSAFFLNAERPLRLRLLKLAEKVLPNWTVLMRFLDDPSDANREAVLSAYRNFTPDERKLIRFSLEKEQADSFPADLLLRYEDETALRLCLEHNLLPSDPSREALFYFLSGQWDRYYGADTDYRRIRLAYEEKDPDLQRRLISMSRESGNNAWLQHISGDPDSIPHNGTLSDQHLLVTSLTEQKQWKRLWEILPNVPLLCMQDVLDALQAADFKPSGIEEQSFLREMQEKIKACEGLSPIPLSHRFLEGAGTALGLSGGGNRFAVLFADRRILVWDTREADAEPLCISSNQMAFRRIVLSHDGKYLCADCGNGVLTVFSLPSGQAIKTLRNDGSPLTGIFLQPDDRRLILLGQNGKGSVFTFPGGAELSRFDIGMQDCFRADHDPQSSRICGITLGGDCMLYDIPEHRPVTALHIGDTPPAVSDVFSGGKLSFIDRDERLSCINLLSGKHIRNALDCGVEKVRRLSEMNSGDLYLLGTLSGQIRVFDPSSGRTPAVLSFGAKSAVAGLWYDQESSMLYGCTANGTVRSWDLSLFRDMCRVLPLMQLPGINRIEEFRKKYPEPGVKAAAEWMKTVVTWRRRFDIELDFDGQDPL